VCVLIRLHRGHVECGANQEERPHIQAVFRLAAKTRAAYSVHAARPHLQRTSVTGLELTNDIIIIIIIIIIIFIENERNIVHKAMLSIVSITYRNTDEVTNVQIKLVKS
jgi:hypothetical protein